MNYFDRILPSPEANLACDEALLTASENGNTPALLRFWESPAWFVVLGHANQAQAEINLPACDRDQVPVLRRCSGGGTVLQGPGCLNYSLILPIESLPALAGITSTNQFIMNRHRAVLQQITGRKVTVQGHTDLAIEGLKFSGNAQRRQRSHLLFHGTFLHHFDLDRIETYLRPPSRQPSYRQHRSHTEFVTNLQVEPETIKKALIREWNAEEEQKEIPTELIEKLVQTRYSQRAWNRKF